MHLPVCLIALLFFGRLAADAQTNSASPLVLDSAQWHLEISSANGGVTEISDPGDAHHMNWVHVKRPWGIVRCRLGAQAIVFDHPATVNAGTAGASDSLYEVSGLKLAVHRAVDDKGRLNESYSLTNTGSGSISLPQGAVSITVSFNDSYNDGAPLCLTNNCNAHLWAGGNSSWANAIRMGGVGPHLGLVLTRGSLGSYCILEGAHTNDRGDLAFNPSAIELKPGETYTVSWALFWHKDWNDFWAFLATQPQFIRMQASHYTVIQGQSFELSAESASPLDGAVLTQDGKEIPVQHSGNKLTATVTADHPGEYVFDLENKGAHTWLRGYATVDPMALIRARVEFIIDKQQVNKPGDPVDGAYLPYDNETEMQFYNQKRFNNHNEGRERMAMGALVGLYIPLCQDAALKQKLLTSLDRYETFLERELQDSQGIVYDQSGYKNSVRRYNFPWMAHVHLAAYDATHDKKYLDLFLKTFQAYYDLRQGADYYMIGIQMMDGLKAFKEAGMDAGYAELLKDFTHHADVIAAKGGNYPKSEVNYEQSIVGPGVQIELEMYLVTKNRKYLDSAKQQLVFLEAFNGQQPDYHLYDLGIRHWDDYWFGKLGLYGDTFPHYWTTITSVAFDEYADATGDESYRTRSRDSFLANMCLFTPDGRGSCAFVYPATLDGHPGYRLDPWANDQDWALVNWLTIQDRHLAAISGAH